METSLSEKKKSSRILLLVLGVLGVALVVGLLVGKMAFRENLSSELKALRTHLAARGLEAEGGQVRRESALVQSRAIFSVKSAGQEYFFFVERCFDTEQAEKRAAELGAKDMVTPERVVQNGVFVLYLSNDWDPNDPLAVKLKQAFREFGR